MNPSLNYYLGTLHGTVAVCRLNSNVPAPMKSAKIPEMGWRYSSKATYMSRTLMRTIRTVAYTTVNVHLRGRHIHRLEKGDLV